MNRFPQEREQRQEMSPDELNMIAEFYMQETGRDLPMNRRTGEPDMNSIMQMMEDPEMQQKFEQFRMQQEQGQQQQMGREHHAGRRGRASVGSDGDWEDYDAEYRPIRRSHRRQMAHRSRFLSRSPKRKAEPAYRQEMDQAEQAPMRRTYAADLGHHIDRFGKNVQERGEKYINQGRDYVSSKASSLAENFRRGNQRFGDEVKDAGGVARQVGGYYDSLKGGLERFKNHPATQFGQEKLKSLGGRYQHYRGTSTPVNAGIRAGLDEAYDTSKAQFKDNIFGKVFRKGYKDFRQDNLGWGTLFGMGKKIYNHYNQPQKKAYNPQDEYDEEYTFNQGRQPDPNMYQRG